jgi:hypothetical protein
LKKGYHLCLYFCKKRIEIEELTLIYPIFLKVVLNLLNHHSFPQTNGKKQQFFPIHLLSSSPLMSRAYTKKASGIGGAPPAQCCRTQCGAVRPRRAAAMPRAGPVTT